MLAHLLLAVGLVLGPLLLARVRTLPPAPGGIVVSPTAPKLDMAVLVDADPSDPSIRQLVASLTGQRPQPEHIVIAPGATAPAGVDMVVAIEPQVILTSPETLDRVAAELLRTPDRPIAIQPWQKTAARYEALGMFFVLASTMTIGAFTVLGAIKKPARIPTGLVARKVAANSDHGVPRVLGGGYIVAERRYPNGVRDLVDGWTSRVRAAWDIHDPMVLLATTAYLYAAWSVALRLVVEPSWATFGWYAAYVFSISLCLRQVGRLARFATVIYPLMLVFFAAVVVRAAFMRGPA